MIIAHVVSSLTTGGAEKLVADMSTMLTQKGVKVKVISILKHKGIPYEILKQNNIELIELNYTSRFNPKIAYDIYVKTKKCNIVHTHTFYAQLYSAILINKKKLVTTEHSTHNRRREIKLFRILDYVMYKKYKNIICITSATESNLNNWLKSTIGKTKVITNGIKLENYINAQAVDKSFFSISDDKYVLTCVASLTKQKNHIKLIEAMKSVNKNINLFIVGDGTLKNKLVQKVTELNLEKQVYFLGNQSNIPGILKASDAFVLPSLWEGFGLVAVEAAAAGIPLIISNVPGLNSLFDSKKIYKIEANDEQHIAKILNKVYLETKKNIRIVDMNELERYSIDIMMDKYMEVYMKI